MVGIALNENDIKSPYYYNGYFACLCCGKLFSGAPHNYKNKIINIHLLYENEIVLIMNMKKKTLKILVNSNEEEIYSDINTEKPLFPAVILRNKYDSVEITDYYQEYQKIIKEKKNEEENKKKEDKEEKKEEDKKEE